MIKFIKRNTLLKVLSLNGLAVIVNFVLGVFSLKVISHYLGAPGMALTGSFRNFTSLFKSLSINGFSQSFIKLLVENKDDEKERSLIVSTFLWLFLGTSIGLGILIILFAESLSAFVFRTEVYSIYIRLFGLLLPFVALHTFFTTLFNGLLWYKKIVIITIISSIVTFVVTVSLIINYKIEGALLAIALAELVLFLVILFVAFKNRINLNFDIQKVIAKKHFKVIRNISFMAIVSGIIIPLNLILIRNQIIDSHSINEAGIWDATSRISGFYMMFFTTGLSFYYIPKLSSIHTDSEFKIELKNYYKTILPLFFIVFLLFFLFDSTLIKIALTDEFQEVKSLLYWQLLGDFMKLLTLAFGYQILIKTMMTKYFIVELVFNLFYFLFAYLSIPEKASLGAVQAYCLANGITFLVVIVMFRKTIFSKTS